MRVYTGPWIPSPGGSLSYFEVLPGTLITYIVYAENAYSPGTTTSVFVTDTLPFPASSFVSATGSYSLQGNSLIWNVGTLIPGSGSPTFNVVVRVPLDTSPGTVFTNTATAMPSATEHDVDLSNNTRLYTGTVLAPAATYGVVVSPPPTQTASAGATVTATFVVSNTGNAPDTFTLTYSQTLGWVNVAGLPSSVTLAAGASTTIQVPVVVPTSATSRQLNQITLTARSQADAAKTSTQATTVSAGQRKVSLPIVVRLTT